MLVKVWHPCEVEYHPIRSLVYLNASGNKELNSAEKRQILGRPQRHPLDCLSIISKAFHLERFEKINAIDGMTNKDLGVLYARNVFSFFGL